LTFLDVGQGDAILVELPDGERIMIDGGGIASGAYRSLNDEGSFSIGEDVLTPYLFSRGIRQLDALVLTHAHYDHMDGLFDLLNNFEVGELWLGRNPMVPRYRDLLTEASLAGVPIRWLSAGDQVGPFQVLNPPLSGPVGTRVANDDSLVLLLDTGGHTAMFTGDLESDLFDAPAHVTVLKVPHHGSRNTQLDVRADFPVISVGANNSFGHPHASKLPALRTDILGAIEIVLTPQGPLVSFPGL
jgi:competence protein ComEC